MQREFDEFVAYSTDEHSDIDLLVAKQMLKAADEIMRRSPLVGRIHNHRSGRFAMGRLDARETAFNIAAHREEPVVFWVQDRTVDIAENRLLTEAVIRSFHLLPLAERQAWTKTYSRWTTRFPRSRDVAHDLQEVSGAFASKRYGGARDYYRKALMLAEVLLGSSGLGVAGTDNIEGEAVLINTANTYEKYIRNTIARSHADLGFVVCKGDAWPTSLYTDGSRQTIPDIVVYRDRSVKLIADAKYKEPSASDHYQMYVYLQVFGIGTGLLLAPTFNEDTVMRRKFSTADGKSIWEVYLPMMNLEATEELLGGLITHFSA